MMVFYDRTDKIFGVMLNWYSRATSYLTWETCFYSPCWCTPRDRRWRRSTSSSSTPAPNSDTAASRPPSTRPPSWGNSRRTVCARKRREPLACRPPRRRSKIVFYCARFTDKENKFWKKSYRPVFIHSVKCSCCISFEKKPEVLNDKSIIFSIIILHREIFKRFSLLVLRKENAFWKLYKISFYRTLCLHIQNFYPAAQQDGIANRVLGSPLFVSSHAPLNYVQGDVTRPDVKV